MPIKLFILALLSVHMFGSEKIVALSPAINEIIFALNAGEMVVGNTEYCSYPSKANKLPKVGGYFSPSLEKIMALKPDIVIMQDNNPPLADKLRHLGIQTMVVKIGSIASVKKAIFDIAKLLKKEQEALAIIKKIDNSLQQLKGIVSDKRVLMPIEYHAELSKEIFVAGQNLYFDDIIEASGNSNALQSTQKGQPVLNLEKILKINPDIVIILASLMKEKKISKEALIAPWLKLPINAAKTKSVFVEEGDYAGVPSDRVIYFINDFRGFLLESKNR